MDPDLNIYDLEHVCTAHPRMSRQEWERIYREAWSLYYTPEHMRTLLRRMAATGGPMGSLVKLLVAFATTVPLESVHPLQSGHPASAASVGTPTRPEAGASLEFWRRFVWETLSKHAVLAVTIGRVVLMKLAIERDPKSRAYMDQALEPVDDEDESSLDLLTQTTGALAAVAHERKIAELTGASRSH